MVKIAYYATRSMALKNDLIDFNDHAFEKSNLFRLQSTDEWNYKVSKYQYTSKLT